MARTAVTAQTKRASGVIAEIGFLLHSGSGAKATDSPLNANQARIARSAGPAMVFEAQGLPQGTLLSKTLGEPGQRGGSI